MMDAVYLLALAALMHAIRSFSPGSAAEVGTSLGFGYLLLTAYLGGRLFARFGLPRLTGHLFVGAIVGPAVVGLVTAGMVENLRIVNGVAVALIAATAGTELDLRRIRPLFRTIAWTLTLGVAVAWVAIAAVIVVLRGSIPFLAGLDPVQMIAVAVVLAVVLVAQSPAVVVALADELRADGPVTRAALGVVVLADLVVIALFAVASAGAKAVLGTAADVTAALRQISWEVVGSITGGIVLAALIAAYLRFVRRGASLFVLASAFVVAEAGGRLGLDPLLVALSAGVAVRNATRFGGMLHDAISGSAAPVYVTFFAVAGATIHLGGLALMAVPILALVAVRAAALLVAGRAGARLAGAPAEVARWTPFALLPQAGLALALALLFTAAFPELGPDASALLLGVIAVNEIAAPVLYRIALIRSGEAGKVPETGPGESPPGQRGVG